MSFKIMPLCFAWLHLDKWPDRFYSQLQLELTELLSVFISFVLFRFLASSEEEAFAGLGSAYWPVRCCCTLCCP